jgi:hypothetical protein
VVGLVEAAAAMDEVFAVADGETGKAPQGVRGADDVVCGGGGPDPPLGAVLTGQSGIAHRLGRQVSPAREVPTDAVVPERLRESRAFVSFLRARIRGHICEVEAFGVRAATAQWILR